LLVAVHAWWAFGPPSVTARVWVRRMGRFTAIGLGLAVGYLAYWGVIGMRTWA
jgi:hypothetical protein